MCTAAVHVYALEARMHIRHNLQMQPLALTAGLMCSMAHSPRRACSFSTSSRTERRAAHQGPTKAGRKEAMLPGQTQATRPTVMALQGEGQEDSGHKMPCCV